MTITYLDTPTLTQAWLALPFIASLDTYYPKVSDWYINTVIPGVYTGDDKILMALEGTRLVGLALGKAGPEPKLRCVRVEPSWQSRGLGIRLMDRLFETLGTTTPHATVSEELLHDYSRVLVNRYGFKLDEVTKGLYRPGKLEYQFNC